MPDILRKNIGPIIASVFALAIFVFMVIHLKHEVDKTNQTFNDVNQQIIKMLHEQAEESYFEGQKDYLNGEIKIRKEGNCYTWIASPWNHNNETDPKKMSTFQPPCE
jgi:hypothetical protein